jgi:hypothetical protein
MHRDARRVFRVLLRLLILLHVAAAAPGPDPIAAAKRTSSRRWPNGARSFGVQERRRCTIDRVREDLAALALVGRRLDARFASQR